MLRTPSSRRSKKPETKLNLVPVMDSVFILIFFLIMSASFLKVLDIPSDVPTISNTPPPKNQKKPLGLTLVINKNNIYLQTGAPSVTRKVFKKVDGEYDLEGLHQYLVKLKQKHLTEDTAIFEPKANLTYEEIIKIMDAVRLLRDTDESIFVEQGEGDDKISTQLKTLFSNIVFGNIMS